MSFVMGNKASCAEKDDDLRLTGGAAGRTRYMYDVSFAARQYHHHMFSSQLMPIN
jgi:hypothetical protein